MKMIFRYMRPYWKMILLGVGIKLFATMTELMLPYILEHLIDVVVPQGNRNGIWLWGIAMIACALATWLGNMKANRMAVDNAHNISYDVRRDLFNKTVRLCGARFDEIGLPSLTSRMTSDSYNVQNFVRALQTLCIRAPIMLLGGIIVTITMDPVLSGLLCAIVPVLLLVVVTISRKGIPRYQNVQNKLDNVIRAMRENITGIRVVKALSKTEYEKKRFHDYNGAMTDADIRTSTLMAIPSPFMQMCLNVALTLVVYVGAVRVNSGAMKSGVILAFLTYFTLVMQSIMAINRMFMMVSKASASAGRIDQVLQSDEGLPVGIGAEEKENMPFISFSHVHFSYASDGQNVNADREQCLYDINFQLNRGESLGIIGPTGCGKTTIINLLMRFYDADSGEIRIDGRDVRNYEKDSLHSRFGVVFQNDIVFMDSLRQNVSFSRDLSETDIRRAVLESQAAEFIDSLEAGLDHMADIKGANLSGGQRQRLLIARALAGKPEILILDDASSALDYKTDALLRKAIFTEHSDSAIITVAQRVSSVMGMTNILMLDNGRCVGYGPHEKLMQECPAYRDIYNIQMGVLE